jgi:hypothetical protein
MESINETIKYNLYICATPNKYKEVGELPFDISVETYDSSQFSHSSAILLETIEKEITIDSEFDLRGMQVADLEEQKAKMIAEHHMAVIALDNKISSLLAIEHES